MEDRESSTATVAPSKTLFCFGRSLVLTDSNLFVIPSLNSIEINYFPFAFVHTSLTIKLIHFNRFAYLNLSWVNQLLSWTNCICMSWGYFSSVVTTTSLLNPPVPNFLVVSIAFSSYYSIIIYLIVIFYVLLLIGILFF
jgi:hypothetical protein